MTSKVEPEHLKTPFFVEYAENDECEDWETKYFKTWNEAKEFAESIYNKHWTYLLGEVGTYKSRNGNQIQDYIYVRWNGYFDHEHSDRGVGKPCGAETLHEPYLPYSDQ